MASSISYAQKQRLIQLNTPLGANKLLVRSFSGHEEVSRLFHFEMELLSNDLNIKAVDIVGKPVTLSVVHADNSTKRYFNGYVSRFIQMPSKHVYARYRAEVVPWLWFLTRTTDCRIYQKKKVNEVIEDVFSRFGFSDYTFELRGSYPQREFCVQYRETSFDFISRLMEEEGIYYFFRHEDGKHTMVIADQKSSYKPCPYQNEVRMEPATGAGFGKQEDFFTGWERHCEFRPGKWAQEDFNFQTPTTNLMANVSSVIPLQGVSKYEIYDYPGEYENKGEGDRLTKVRMEQDETPYDVVHGEGYCRALVSGFTFKLTRHERNDQLAEYFLTSVTHEGVQGGFFAEAEEPTDSYSNRFTAIPNSVLFRPERTTPRPYVHGTQTAIVVGPSGEEIYTDKYARVVVQFHWDRLGKKNENSSCWIRVSQVWASRNFGAIWIPRIGDEVIVDFLEGDPDRPLIVGCVYNDKTQPPYSLPGKKEQSGFLTNSSKGGGGSNELRIDDTKGSEEVWLHGQKDWNTVIENDVTQTIKMGNETMKLEKGNQSLTLDMGNQSTQLKMGNQSTKMDLGKSEHEAMQSIELKVGQSSVKLDQSGVTIKGIMITIQAQAMVQMKAPMIQISADGMLMEKGGIVMIN